MSNSSKKRQTTKTKRFLQVGGGVIATAILALAIKGTIFGGNFVGLTALNTNPSFIVDQNAYVTPIGTLGTECSATGGLSTYDTCYLGSPFGTGSELARGLNFGTGMVVYAQLEILSNPSNVSIDCSRVGGPNEGTGGTVIFDNKSGTGVLFGYANPFTLGPTQGIKCGTLNGSVTGLDVRLRGIMMDSNLTN